MRDATTFLGATLASVVLGGLSVAWMGWALDSHPLLQFLGTVGCVAGAGPGWFLIAHWLNRALPDF